MSTKRIGVLEELLYIEKDIRFMRNYIRREAKTPLVIEYIKILIKESKVKKQELERYLVEDINRRKG